MGNNDGGSRPRAVRLDLLSKHEIRIASANLGEKECAERACDAASEEDWVKYRHVSVEGKEREGNHSLHKIAGVPIFSASVLKASAEMIAPALPQAADMPCAKARKRVGKTSAG